MQEWHRITHLGVWPNERLQLGHIRDESILLLQLPQRDVGTQTLGHAVQLLVGRVDTDGMVSGADQRVQGEKVCSNSALSDESIFGREICCVLVLFVEGDDVAAECIGTADGSIDELGRQVEGVAQGLVLRQANELVQRHRRSASLRNVETAWRHLVLVHPLLDVEGGDADHGGQAGGVSVMLM